MGTVIHTSKFLKLWSFYICWCDKKPWQTTAIWILTSAEILAYGADKHSANIEGRSNKKATRVSKYKRNCGYKASNTRQDKTWKLWYNRSTLLQSGCQVNCYTTIFYNRKKYWKETITLFKFSVKYRKGDFTQFLDPVLQFSCLNGENKCLFCCFHQKGPTIPWTAFDIRLRNTNAVVHFYHL